MLRSFICFDQIEKKYHIVVPYSQGQCESYKAICSKYVVQVHFKGGNTLIKSLLMFPKDKDIITKESNIIHCFKLGKTECDDEYIGGQPEHLETDVKNI